MKFFKFKNKDKRIDVPQEFKDLYKALEKIEKANWESEEYIQVEEVRVILTKYDNQTGFSIFDELFSMNKKYKLDK